LLDILHEQERLKALPETASIGSGGQINAMETAEVGGMSRWTTEEDLSSQNIGQFKASSLADFTQCERTGISFHLFGLCCQKDCHSFLAKTGEDRLRYNCNL
jgi:hypothetical protein